MHHNLLPGRCRNQCHGSHGVHGSIVWILALAMLMEVTMAQKPTATATMRVVKQSDLEIILTKTISAPRDRVFRALTEPAAVMQWMKVGHLQLVDCEIEPRVGGSLRYQYQRPSGKQIEVRGVFEKVDAPRELRYLESYDFSPLTIVVTTTLEDAGRSTELKQTLRYRTKDERDADFPNIESSSPTAYANLDRYLALGASTE